MTPLIKLAVGIAGTALIADAAYRLVRSPLLSDLGSRTAAVMAANGITDGRANWVTDNGWTWRIARLSGTADAATRIRTQQAVAALVGVADAGWEQKSPGKTVAVLSHRDIAACQARLDTLVTTRQLGFEPQNATLLPASQRLLDAIAQTLQTCPGAHVGITDHTITTGSAAANLALSQARAAVLVTALVDRGISAAALSAAGNGDADLLDSTATQAHRVNFRVTGQETIR